MPRSSAIALALTLLSGAGCVPKTPCQASCGAFFSDLELADWPATTRKSALALAGRLPSSFERELVAKDGQAGFESVLDVMMTEEPFYDRLKEIYNDLLLTDQYLNGGAMILDDQRFPNREYYQQFGQDSPQYVANKAGADFGIAREPLNIIAHVVRENRSFKEILTANYTLINAYSAQSYSLLGETFVGNVGDRNNLKEVQISGIPHAGILTTPAFLNRFPTSATNRNRHRSRYTYLYFLDVDVLQFGVRPVSVSDISSGTPTMTDPTCVACHTYVDPIAGTYQNWNDTGFYRPPEGGWYKDMFQPGYQNQSFVPAKDKIEGLRWLAQRIVQQDGFVRATVKAMFTGFTGQIPIGLPNETDSPEGQAQQNAFDAQTALFYETGKRFIDSGYNLKSIVKNLMLSPYWRATNIKADAPPERALDYAQIGMGRMLTPEMLNRKIKTVLALDRYWGQPADLAPTEYLLSSDYYLIYYGGIDSVATTTRITAPNGVAVNIARRMSNELACQAVPLDLAQKRADRALFPYVDASTLPEDASQTELPAGASAVQKNLSYLYDRLLGESVAVGDDELGRSYDLFIGTLREGQAGIGNGSIPADLPDTCSAAQDHWTEQPVKGGSAHDPNYTIRAWMAVVSYLLGDYKFLYE